MSIKPTVIRDISIGRWSWDGRYFLPRDRDPADNRTPLFVPEEEVLRFVLEDWWDRPRGETQFTYHGAIVYSSLRLRAVQIHQRIFVCDGCGQFAGDCTSKNVATQCLACSNSADEWRDGEILRNIALPMPPDCGVSK